MSIANGSTVHHASDPVQKLLDRLERKGYDPRQSGDGKWRSLCPGHKGDSPSLSISTGSGGAVLLNCNRGDQSGKCSAATIVAELGLQLKDLFPPTVGLKASTTKTKRMGWADPHDAARWKASKLDAVIGGNWLYHDRDGGRVYAIVFRFNLPDGSKSFCPVSRDPDTGRWHLKDPPKWLPFRIDKAADAPRVFFWEGEKCATLAWEIGLPSVTTAHGAKSPQKSNLADLAGREIVIAPDVGEAGEGYMAKLVKLLGKLDPPARVKVLRLPGLADDGDDIEQFIESRQGATAEELRAEIEGLADALPYLDELGKAAEIGPKPSKNGDGAGPHGATVGLDGRPDFELSDLGNARRLIHHHGRTILYCHDWKCWLTYAIGCWNRDRSGAVQGMAKKVSKYVLLEIPPTPDQKTADAYKKFSHESQACKKIRDLMDLARSDVPVLPEQLDADPWSFNMLNGTLDLRTGKLGPHNSEDFCTKQSPINFDPTAAAPRFEQFESEVFNGDADLIGYVRRKIGYALTGDDSVQEIDIWYGEGSNGKNLYADTVRALLGDYACQAESSLLLQKRTDDHPTGVADLQGKRFVTASETDDGRRIAEALVKQLTGDAVIKARRMHENFFEFARTFKLFLCTNHKPVVRGTDHAIWRRIRLVPFGVKFVKQGEPTTPPLILEEDLHLKEKLIAEGPGIINLFLAACLDWQKDGMRPPEAVKAATDEFRSEMDTVSGFLAECCKSHLDNPALKDVARVNKTVLYEAYCEWCKGNRLTALTTHKCSRELTSRGYELRPSSNNYYRYGLSLIQESGESTSPENPKVKQAPQADEPLPDGLLDEW